ncbi:MAG TPA: hypothetical protein VN613_04755, partial [Gemmatimonadaceae bacterium]|nr:hypothetical protein [Gemmatimonadaceae bacterium]
KPEMVSDVDREVLNGMTSSQVAQTLKGMSGITAQESKIIAALSGKGVATPAAAAVAGTSQEGLQSEMNNAPGFAGQQTRAKVSQARLGLAEDDQATRAGDKFLKNPKLQNYVGIINKANSDLSLLNDPSRPIAPQTLSEVEATIPKLLDAAGSNALGAVERQEIMTGRRRLANLMQNMSGDVQDMRKFNPQIVQFVQHTVERLKDLNESNAANLSVNIARGLETNSNPKVQDTVKAMLEQHFADKHPYYLNRFAGASAAPGQAGAPPAAGGASGSPGAPPAPPARPAQPGTAQAPVSTPNPANPSNPIPQPKITADQKSMWRQQALQKLQQIRSAPAGTMKMTEQDVRNTYRLLTNGDELQE